MAPQEQAEAQTRVPLWTYNDIPKYSLPKGKGDPWDELLEPLLKDDNVQCEVWKDEVTNLLIFAGLFSAVVTAFIVESYKGLQADPDEAIVALLSQIATSLNTGPPSNGSSSSATVGMSGIASISQKPSLAISRVNILWFISLVLSLTTVLVGTVSLQWLREHRRNPAQSSPKERFAIFNMRREGIKDWYVPQIFLALPLLLQSALVLFLAGLVEFLLLIAPPNVYIPVIIVVGLPILFLLLTTIIPSLQWILSPEVLCLLRRHVPSQCPYLSPQASVFGSILVPTVMCFWDVVSFVLHLAFGDHSEFGRWTSWPYIPRPTHFRYQASCTTDDMALHYRERCHEELYMKKLLAQRPMDTPKSLNLLMSNTLYYRAPIYDWVTGLLYSGSDERRREQLSVQAATNQCMRELTTLDLDDTYFHTPDGWFLYIQYMLNPEWPNCKIYNSASSLIADNITVGQPWGRIIDNFKEMATEETFIIITCALARLPETVAQFHELYIRVMSHFVLKPLQKPAIDPNAALGVYLLTWERKMPGPVRHLALQADVHSEISQQYAECLHMLFTVGAIQDNAANANLSDTFSAYPHITELIGIACRVQDHQGKLSTLQLLETQMQNYQSTDSPEYLLHYLMACYLGHVMIYTFYDPNMLQFHLEHDESTNPYWGIKKDLLVKIDALTTQFGQYHESIGMSPQDIIIQRRVNGGYERFARCYSPLLIPSIEEAALQGDNYPVPIQDGPTSAQKSQEEDERSSAEKDPASQTKTDQNDIEIIVAQQ